MFCRIRIALGIALLIAIALAFPVFAGDWAVIPLDEFPTGVVAGEPLTIGFTVLQHGRTPMEDLEPTVTAQLSFKEKFVVNAEPEGKAGHYVATLVFPKQGNWEWSIQAFTMDQVMPVLNVAAPALATVNQPVVKTEPAAGSVSLLSAARILALALGLIGLGVAFRRKSRLAMVLTVSCLLIGVGSFMTGAIIPEVEAQGKSSSEVAGSSSASQIELGRQLFIAKGCITCHVNSKIPGGNAYRTIEMGAPDLSKFSASPEALRLRLKDPSSVKSDTKMPNLNLSEAEIEALIAFINSK